MNMEKQGTVFPPYKVTPDRRLARLFMEGSGVDVDPVEVPPTYLIFLRGETLGVNVFTELNIPRQKALHGGQRYDWVRPVQWGETLTTTVSVKSIIEKQGSNGKIWFADIEYAYDDETGARVVTEISRLIERE